MHIARIYIYIFVTSMDDFLFKIDENWICSHNGRWHGMCRVLECCKRLGNIPRFECIQCIQVEQPTLAGYNSFV